MALFSLEAETGTDVPTATPVEGVGLVDNWRHELDAYYGVMREFAQMDVTDVLMALSSFSARAAEMRSYLVRRDDRRANALRTKEIDPFLEEVERQFRIHSRLQAVRELEARLVGGQF